MRRVVAPRQVVDSADTSEAPLAGEAPTHDVGAPDVATGVAGERRTADRWRRWRPDLLGIAWVLAAGVLTLLPALIHGSHLGSFDQLSRFGLSKTSGVTVHNISNGDQVDALLPWTTVAWQQVHQGHLPLWNPYGGLGLPLAFNWQSAPFALSSIIGYAAPMQYAYTVGVFVTLFVAGTGAYFFARQIGLGVMGSAMAGTAFELSGPFMGWLGWPHAAVVSWIGWIFGGVVLIVRGRRRVRAIALFSIALAFSVYAGQPEILVLLLLAAVVFALALLVLQAWRDGIATSLRSTMDLGIAAVLGLAFSAPLLLPGVQVNNAAARNAVGIPVAVPVDAGAVLTQGYNGLPIAGTHALGFYGLYYTEYTAYVGLVALVLAVLALVTRWRRREVLALGLVTLVTGVIAFNENVEVRLTRLPALGVASWHRALLPLAFAVAVLAGVGLDALVRSTRRRVWAYAGGGFALGLLAVGMLYAVASSVYPVASRTIREHSLLWPAVSALVGLGAVAGFFLWDRRRSARTDGERSRGAGPFRRLSFGFWAGLVLLGCQTAFGVTAGAPIWSSSAGYFTPTAAETQFVDTVGSSLVASGSANCLKTGILPDVNDVYGVHDLAFYDPSAPSEYWTSWRAVTGQSQPINEQNYQFCPVVDSAALARRYGVGYILEPPGKPGPAGTVHVATLDGENLYRVPGAARATLTPLGEHGALPPAGARGSPVAVHTTSPSSWQVVTDAKTAQVLRLHLTDSVGWKATIDGKPLALERYSGVMLQARIPPGRHLVSIEYWPSTFTLGLVLAGVAAVGLATAAVLARRRHRRTEP